MKASELAGHLECTIEGKGEAEITNISSPEDAAQGSLVFFDTEKQLFPTKAAAAIVPVQTRIDQPVAEAVIYAQIPKLAFALAAKLILGEVAADPGMHKSAQVHPSAKIAETADIGPNAVISKDAVIGNNTIIGAGCFIAEGVIIGEQCWLKPSVIISANAKIGNRVLIHSGAVIGADGFGFVKKPEGKYIKFPQIGSVIIEDDVEIGANTCIDRGALGNTVIGSGTKIDNLVQIAHNVKIGKNCVIAAQTGISGSVTIEDNCTIGGQVGFGDHVLVKSGAVIGSQAGVLPGKIVRPGVWWGTPIQPLDEYKRQNARVKGLERLFRKIEELENKLKSLLT
jgi:UDP-3-O-[3-hydroxymyristoyl] glucosamine N-acyltransferase